MTTKRPATIFHHFRHPSRRAKAFIAVVMSMLTATTGLQAQGPAGGVVRAGNARISGEGTSATRIDQTSDRAVVDWRSFGIGANDQVIFVQPSATSATLNRVTGEQVSVILGRLDANGQVLLINPNGIVFGGGAQINTGSLIATTSNISDSSFMAGRLEFDVPGRPGAGVFNGGSITAAEGGLVAFVAPHVRNDGVIVARLGKVLLGSADTFTIDLYGDALINLALSDVNVSQLRTADGQPVTSLVTNTGRIETAGGQTVLMTARNAKNVLDSLINMSGTIKADTAVQQGGRILLLGAGGTIGVSGALSAQGETGGSIQVLGDRVHIGGAASLDASGTNGGGIIHVGGAFQGSGNTYRSLETTVDTGASLAANALAAGHGGEVVVWSDGRTRFAGAVEAKGGANGGNGGTLEVSGKQTLDFLGQANASAAAGKAGSLLLDPAILDIGAAEASTITRVLRTGTTATLQADIDINVNSAIYPGDRDSGGGLTMTAGQNINVNDYIVTDNGAITMTATNGTVNVAAGKAVFAGNAPITVTTGGALHTGPLVTTGALALQSMNAGVAIDTFIDGHTGPVSIKAAGPVDINQPIVNMASGAALNVTAGTDINVNAQVDGRGGVEGGTVTMTAARDVNVNQPIVTNNGAIALTATNGSINRGGNGVIVSGTAPLSLNARGDISTGGLSSGALTINSTAGDVTIAEAIVNGQTGANVTVTSGRDVNVNAVIDGRGGVPGGAVNLTAGRNLNVNEFVLTNNGAINLTATTGTATVAAGKGTSSGNAPTVLRSAGDLTIGTVTAGSLSATSANGSVLVNGVIDGNTGRTDLTASGNVVVNAAILNGRTGAPLNVSGRDVIVNQAIDGRGGAGGGAISLQASRDVIINNSVMTNNAGIGLTAGNAATMAVGTALASGNGAIAMTAGGDITTQGIAGGSLAATSTAGSVLVAGVVDSVTGRVDLAAGRNVTVNAPVLNLRTGAALNATAGQDVIVNTAIDGRGGAAGGAVSLQAAHDVLLNANVATQNGGISVTAANGATMAAGTALVSGNGAIAITAGGDVTTQGISGGSLAATSTAGSILLAGVVDGNTGRVDLTAARNVAVNSPVLNLRTGAALNATAGQDINVNAQIDGTGGATGGSVNLTAGRDVNVATSIATNNGAIRASATNGAATVAAGAGLYAGAGAITLDALGAVSTGTINGGVTNITSRGGTVTVSGQITGTGGAMTIGAADQVTIAQAITNPGLTSPLTVTAGTNINVNAAVGRSGPGVASSAVTLSAGQNVSLNKSIETENAAISVTATNGTVTTAAGEGLFAGAGAIAIVAGQTLNTGTVNTTGAVSFRSTGGSVNVNAPIDPAIGGLTINAATDVNVNQAIANPRTSAAVNVTAGHDININATIDGRSSTLPGPSGTVTLTAGNDIDVNQDITTVNRALSLTATAGTVTTAAGKGLFAGSGPISVTSGATLNTGITSTTGALSFRSTNGAVNVNQIIADTTGAVSITAGTAVNVNQEITNLKTGNNLNVTAGTDINVLAKVDGRSGTAAGGAVSMTSGNNINLTKAISTNNGAVSLTATNGTVVVPVGTETTALLPAPELGGSVMVTQIATPMEAIVTAGSAAVNVTTGGNFTLASPIKTTGALNITSTGGSITTAAPIGNETGTVTLTAHDALVVNREIKSNNQAITLNAGAGGITVNTITDYDYSNTSPINAGNANLALNSVGNVTISDYRGLSSQQTVSIDTRGQIVSGSIGNSTKDTLLRPLIVNLNADGGIVDFSTGHVPEVNATSSGGSINMLVEGPNKIRVTTGTPGTLDCPTCDITVQSTSPNHSIGTDVVFNAGGSIIIPNSFYSPGNISFTARSGDISMTTGGTTQIAQVEGTFTAVAARDVLINDLLWMGGGPGETNGGPVSFTAGRDIVSAAGSQIHVGNAQMLTFLANRHISLRLLETLGGVSLTATTGNITLNNDIGAHIVNGTGFADFNPSDLGVASFTMSAPAASAAITMQGARAQGNVVITTGGSLTAAKAITSVLGSVTITAPTQNLSQAVPIGSQNQINYPAPPAPAIPPGPQAPLATAPGVAANVAAGLPAFAEIAVSAADQVVGGPSQPGASTATVAMASAPNATIGLPGAAGSSSAPGGTGSSNTRPNPPSGQGTAQANGSSDPGSVDTASALRTAGASCGDESAADTGLASAARAGTTSNTTTPKEDAVETGNQKSASCPPATTGGQASP